MSKVLRRSKGSEGLDGSKGERAKGIYSVQRVLNVFRFEKGQRMPVGLNGYEGL